MIRVLELRSVNGTGGGPDKTILRGAAPPASGGVSVSVCYLRDVRDSRFTLDRLARSLGVDYLEIAERHSFDPAIWRSLREVIRTRGIQVVHAHDYKTNVLALLAAKAEGTAALTTEHGWNGVSPRERFLYYPLDKRLARYFPRVIAVSDEIRSELVRHGARPDRVITILNGIDPVVFQRRPGRRPEARASLSLTADDIVVGSVGRVAPEKRLDLLIRAVHALRGEYPRLRLLIAGDGHERRALEALTELLEMSDRVTFLGHRTDIVDLHHAFDLFVQSSSYEGTPNVVLEAMAMETPVVASDAGGTRQICADGRDGLIVPMEDLGALVSAIRSTLADPQAAQRRVWEARRRVEQELSFAARTRAVEQVYRDLVRNPSTAEGTRKAA